MVHVKKIKNYQRFFSDLFKRLLDIIFSVLGLLIVSPFFLAIAIRVKRDSPGPILFRGKRAGRNDKIFKILKFRTMQENPQSYQGPPVTAKDDPRITPFGRWLRDTKLNELPQLWNVLIGDMSFVGPRPEDPEIVKNWPEDVRREILSLRPGITSPASVLYRDEENMLRGSSLMDFYLGSILPSKLRLDQLYVHHHSFWLDIDVIFWTIILIFPRLSKYQLPEGRLFSGPFFRFINRFLNWFLVDTFICLVAIGLTGLFWRTFGPLDVGWPRAIVIAIAFAFLFSITGVVMGVNRISWSNATGEDILILAPAVLIGMVLALIFNYISGIIFWQNEWIWGAQSLIPQGMVLLASLLSFLGFVLFRYRYRIMVGLEKRWLARWTELPFARERVLIIGGGESGQLAAALLSTSSYSNRFRVLGFIDDDLYKQRTRIQGVDVIGQRDDIPRLVQKYDIGIILFAIHNISPQERAQLLSICESTKARTVLFPDVPAALNTLISEEKAKSSSSKVAKRKIDAGTSDGNENLPCHLCLIKISPLQMDRWLHDMEIKTKEGDLEGLQNLLTEIRTILTPETTSQESTRGEQE